MNALILSGVLGVIMLFSGLWLKEKAAVRKVAVAGLALLLVINLLDMNGISLVSVDVTNMMRFDRFSFLPQRRGVSSSLT